VTLVGVEQDGGLRDGHEYWRHGAGWAVHVRWYGLHWVLLHLQRRHDDGGLREILQDGTVLFDKANLAPTLADLARRAVVHRQVPAREAYRARGDLAGAIDRLDDLYARADDSPAAIGVLFEVYLLAMRVADRISPRSEVEARVEIARRLGRAGRSRADLSAGVLALRDLCERMLRVLGGRPRREFYAPANAFHLMPPDEGGADRTEAPAAEEFLCTGCGRRFAVAQDAPPVLAADADGAPVAERVTSAAS
jgi:hypothetical protein